MDLRDHAIEQITGRLLVKANNALESGDYAEVIKIRTIQFAFNLGVVTISLGLRKEDTYDMIQKVTIGAISDSELADLAVIYVAELKNLTTHFRLLLQ